MAVVPGSGWVAWRSIPGLSARGRLLLGSGWLFLARGGFLVGGWHFSARGVVRRGSGVGWFSGSWRGWIAGGWFSPGSSAWSDCRGAGDSGLAAGVVCCWLVLVVGIFCRVVRVGG